MSGLRLAIIADDLTGAADSGVQLVGHGYRTAVFFHGEPPEAAGLDAAVLDTDSRSLSPEAARGRVCKAGAAVRSAEIVYKKVDSTLRGNVYQEVEAALRATGRKRAVIAPAFPAGERSTVGGNQLVRGRPVHRTELARDPKTPVREAHIPTLLSGLGHSKTLSVEDLENPRRLRRALGSRDAGHAHVIADAVKDAHLRSLVEAVPDPSAVLWVGSAGLSRALAEIYPGVRGPAQAPVSVRNVLVVVGSLSRISREQAALAAERGVGEVELQAPEEPGVRLAIREAERFLSEGGSVLVRSAPQAGASAAPEAVAAGLAEVVSGLEPGLFEALVLTGGDTAAAVARGLGATGIELLGELEPGVPVGRLRGPRPYPVVTKAGGFGERGTLSKAIEMFTNP